MAKANADDLAMRIDETLSYILLYAPEFPREDATTVEDQFDRALGTVHALWNGIQDVRRRHWLDLLGQELVEARSCFLSGREKDGRGLIQSAQERLKSWRGRKKSKPTFVVGPDGSTERKD